MAGIITGKRNGDLEDLLQKIKKDQIQAMEGDKWQKTQDFDLEQDKVIEYMKNIINTWAVCKPELQTINFAIYATAMITRRKAVNKKDNDINNHNITGKITVAKMFSTLVNKVQVLKLL